MDLMSQTDKIVSIEDLARALASRRSEKCTVVHAHGVFDLLHVGAVRRLEEARQLGDLLVVTLTPDEDDGKGLSRALFKQTLRAETLAALSCVDFVVPVALPRLDAIQMVRPDVYVFWEEDAQAEPECATPDRRNRCSSKRWAGTWSCWEGRT